MLLYARALQVLNDIAQYRPALPLAVFADLGLLSILLHAFIVHSIDARSFAYWYCLCHSLRWQLDLTDNELSHSDIKVLVQAAYPKKKGERSGK